MSQSSASRAKRGRDLHASAFEGYSILNTQYSMANGRTFRPLPIHYCVLPIDHCLLRIAYSLRRICPPPHAECADEQGHCRGVGAHFGRGLAQHFLADRC